jgi:hypothetical protein
MICKTKSHLRVAFCFVLAPVVENSEKFNGRRHGHLRLGLQQKLLFVLRTEGREVLAEFDLASLQRSKSILRIS